MEHARALLQQFTLAVLFVVALRVADRHSRLVGQRPHELERIVIEGTRRLAVQVDHTDDLFLVEDRHGQHCRRCWPDPMRAVIGRQLVDQHRLAVQHGCLGDRRAAVDLQVQQSLKILGAIATGSDHTHRPPGFAIAQRHETMRRRGRAQRLFERELLAQRDITLRCWGRVERLLEREAEDVAQVEAGGQLPADPLQRRELLDADAEVLIGLLVAARVSDRLSRLAGDDRQQPLVDRSKAVGTVAEQLQRADQLVTHLQRQSHIALHRRPPGEQGDQRAHRWAPEVRQAQRAAMARDPSGQPIGELVDGGRLPCGTHTVGQCDTQRLRSGIIEADLGPSEGHQRLHAIQDRFQRLIEP